MNHIMNSDQIENVRNVKASCVFELSLSSKELCDTVQGKIIVVNGEECSSYDTTIETYSKDVTSTEKMPLGISTIIGVKEIEEEEEGNTTHINGIYSNEGTESPRKWIIVVVCLSVFSLTILFVSFVKFLCTYCKKRKSYYHVNSIELKRVPSITSHLSSEVEFCVLNERKQK
ncbi:uncharacterized protein [Mytilus edulis]|uniref:uncharacterized protein n=1 Tax=Mytilus edulis TaxID=6550 RepID=UPI0039EE692F